MRWAFWISIILIAYTYVGYPVWIWLCSKFAARPWMRQEIYPTISIIMAVHNGAPLLLKKIDHLLSLDYPPELIEVIVISDGSTDGTDEILHAFVHPRLRAVICREHRGKAAAISEGIRHATGTILVFTDLRQMLERGAVRSLISNFADSRVGCATGELRLNPTASDHVTNEVGGLYWRYEQRIRTCEGLVDSVIGVSGAFYAVRRELATELPAGLILDDMYQPLCIARRGYRAVLDESARFWDSLPQKSADEFQRKVRTLTGNFQLLQLAPWLLSNQNRLRFQLISHKLLRLLVPESFVILFITSYMLRETLFYFGMFMALTCLIVLDLLGSFDIPVVRRIARPVTAFLWLNDAAAVALVKFLFHRRPLWRTWAPAAAPSSASENSALAENKKLGRPVDIGAAGK